jgi:phosphogluconate dehydratase
MAMWCGCAPHDGTLNVLADEAESANRMAHRCASGMGRELFALMRATADGAEQGGSAMLAAAGL